ncbi:alanine--tRNA ligase-related protein [Ktedonosporobacter rubrisoli]|nr:alanine--tRNA ligase-related protein [Ktedonosporobacter rubrisoli]
MTTGLSSVQITEKYLSFFRARNHLELMSSPLAVPGNSTSFIIAGMQPLLPYLRGEQLPPAPRLTALQRCLRTDDVDMVGTNDYKFSGFHMLGNWSIGNYGKHEVIEMALDLLLNVFGLDLGRLWVTVFTGDPRLHLGLDEEAVAGWLRVGFPPERIVPLGRDDNFWTTGGPGPSGPCSEIFVDRGPAYGCGSAECRPGCSCGRFFEIWNLVFMEYDLLADGSIVPLPQRNIDTGMGLERIAMVLQGTGSAFAIDLFQAARERLQMLAPGSDRLDKTREEHAYKVIVDHMRAVLMAVLAGVEPGRDGSRSVIRRLVRRAARQGRILGIDEQFLSSLLLPLAQAHGSLLTMEEHERVPTVERIVAREERMFARVLTSGLKFLLQLEPKADGQVAGEELFRLSAEKGFPADLAAEVLMERGLSVDWSGYQRSVEEHRRVSRLSAEKHFRRG